MYFWKVGKNRLIYCRYRCLVISRVRRKWNFFFKKKTTTHFVAVFGIPFFTSLFSSSLLSNSDYLRSKLCFVLLVVFTPDHFLCRLSSAVNKLPTLRFNAHTSVQCFGWVTFHTKHRNKNSNRKKNSKKKHERLRQNYFRYFFLSSEDHWKSLIFLLFWPTDRKPTGISTKNVVFMESPNSLHFFFCSLVLFFDVPLCYSSCVDQIKLKHTTAYNLFKSD